MNIVRMIIDSDLFFQDSLSRGYCNLSALARLIKPMVDYLSRRDVKLESIITALKRLKNTYTVVNRNVEYIIANSKIMLRTSVAKLSLIKNRYTIEKILKPLINHYDSFVSVSQGVNSITMIFDQVILEKLKVLFVEDILEVKDNLAAIIVQSPESIIKTPGAVSVFYNQLGRNYVNIEDTISCYTETIILVDMNDVSKAFNSLNDLIRGIRIISNRSL